MVQTQAGDLNHYIAITKPSPSSGYSSDPGQPAAVCQVWAAKKGLAGRDYYAAAGSQAEAEVTYKIRYREDILAGMSVAEGSHTYEIYTPPVDDEGGRQWLYLHCREVLPSGH